MSQTEPGSKSEKYVCRTEMKEAAKAWLESMGLGNRALFARNLDNVETHSDAMFALKEALYEMGEEHD